MKNLRLGIPLAVSMAGTVASLFVGGKRLHTAFGVAWTALSLVHAYQYRKNMKNNAKETLACLGIISGLNLIFSGLINKSIYDKYNKNLQQKNCS